MKDKPEVAIKTGEMKVIGAGFGRTGTLSLKVALEELGFGPCYHMTEVFGKPERFERWEDAARGKPVDWKELLEGYQAIVDWPACAFYAELMEVYPDEEVRSQYTAYYESDRHPHLEKHIRRQFRGQRTCHCRLQATY